jgi:alkylation response protein AidB-like acyl-CoA dehydrogenase
MRGPAMAAELTEEQGAIHEMALEFAKTKLAPFALEWDEKKSFPIETLREAAALGMGGVTVSEALGGSGLGRIEATIIFEALATGCPSIAAFLSIHNMAVWMIDAFGSRDLRERVVPDLASMASIASYCLTEPGAGSDAAALQTRATRDGDDYVVNGTKQFISGAGTSDWYVLMTRTGGSGPSGITALAIHASCPGLTFGGNERKMGWNAQPTRQVILEDCRVPVANRLGVEGEGFRIAMRGLDGGRLNIGACSIGGAQGALDRTLNYMSQRKAFGKSIDQFQALQFRLADMATQLEAARALLHKAARRLDARDPDATRLVAMAKRFATDVGFHVADEALQLHGGYGYLAEYGIEKIVRDLRAHRILEGTNEVMRLIIARGLIDRSH